MERRSFQRYPIQLDVKIRKRDGTPAEIDGTVVDVSFDGLGIIIGEELEPDVEVTIEWQSPPFYFDGEAVAIGAIVSIVKREEESGYFRLGIKFSSSDSELIQSLLNWIQMQANMQRRAESAARRSSRQQKRVKF